MAEGSSGRHVVEAPEVQQPPGAGQHKEFQDVQPLLSLLSLKGNAFLGLKTKN